MNVMAQAHKEARSLIAVRLNITYRMAFRLALIKCHEEYKELKAAREALRLDTIARFEKRIEELKIILNGPDAQKYIVVCEGLPINFESTNGNWTANEESATKWNSRQFAEANARKVRNGNKVAGVAVRLDHQCEYQMQEYCRLINLLNE